MYGKKDQKVLNVSLPLISVLPEYYNPPVYECVQQGKYVSQALCSARLAATDSSHKHGHLCHTQDLDRVYHT